MHNPHFVSVQQEQQEKIPGIQTRAVRVEPRMMTAVLNHKKSDQRASSPEQTAMRMTTRLKKAMRRMLVMCQKEPGADLQVRLCQAPHSACSLNLGSFWWMTGERHSDFLGTHDRLIVLPNLIF